MISLVCNFPNSFSRTEGKKTLRNFRDTLEKRLLRLGNEKAGYIKQYRKNPAERMQQDEKRKKTGSGAWVGIDPGNDGMRWEGKRA